MRNSKKRSVNYAIHYCRRIDHRFAAKKVIVELTFAHSNTFFSDHRIIYGGLCLKSSNEELRRLIEKVLDKKSKDQKSLSVYFNC